MDQLGQELLETGDRISHLIIDSHASSDDQGVKLHIGEFSSGEMLDIRWDPLARGATYSTHRAVRGIYGLFDKGAMILFGGCNILKGDATSVSLKASGIQALFGWQNAYLYANEIVGVGGALRSKHPDEINIQNDSAIAVSSMWVTF